MVDKITNDYKYVMERWSMQNELNVDVVHLADDWRINIECDYGFPQSGWVPLGELRKYLLRNADVAK